MTSRLAGIPITDEQCADFERNGAICLRGVFRDWVYTMAEGIERNMADPGPHATENLQAHEGGRFFDDYCNWQRIPEYRRIIHESPAASIAARAMRSHTAQFFHEHVLVKEATTRKPTPWHQDMPYYFLDGSQTVSFWLPVDPVEDATLRFIAGSHRWSKLVRPVSWASNQDFYGQNSDYLPVPDPDAEPETYTVLEWTLEPGDAVLFHYRTVHGANGNLTGRRRRVLSLRWVGDDVRYAEPPGRASPPFPGHGMTNGQTLREDWFPVLWRETAPA